MTLSKVFHDLFTGIDNKTVDLGRILWAKMAVCYVALTGWHIWQNPQGALDFISWATGAAGLLAGGGAGLRLKSITEPGPPAPAPCPPKG